MDSKSRIIELQLQLKLMERTESTAWDDLYDAEDDSNRSADRPEVRFDLRNTTVVPIESRVSMANDERQAYWYSQEAYRILNGSNSVTKQLMMIGRENPEKYGHCYRGLERCLPETKKIVDDELALATHAVLMEQSRQRQSGISNPSSLRNIYHEAAGSSIDRALAAAKQDAEAAATYQQEYAPPSSSRALISSRPYPTTYGMDPDYWANDDDEASVLSTDSTEDNNYDNGGSKTITPLKKSKGMMKRLKKFIGKTSKTRQSSP